ncbi:MAG: arginine--tRNA ligase [Candidatus Marinimicrobia bacterium]|nr:arginine--tRNA ligase [Candidatus Neomarinimicrobiota bacterium]
MNLKSYLIQQLNKALAQTGLPASQPQVSPTRDPQFGDLSTNLALTLTNKIHRKPLEIASEIKAELTLDNSIISQVTVTPPGFINFFINDNYYRGFVKRILTEKQAFGKGSDGNGKTANVEFVSANPTGPLTVGHGRQAVLGDTVANILEWHGYDVTREYYYNDAGRQMRLLGQSVEIRYFQELGQNIELPKDGYQGNYIREIARNIRSEQGDRLETGDPVFRKAAEATIFSDIKQSLASLGIYHKRFANEKDYYESGAVDQLVADLKSHNLVYESEGAAWFKTTALGKKQDRVLIKGSGEPTYRLPDMAYHRDKLERNFDFIVDLFGADHSDTYPDVLLALETLGYDVKSITVLIHQFVTLVRGGEKVKMSTRKANFVTLEDLVNLVGADVVRYFFIMRGMNSHLNFDLDLAENESEKNPVYYLQYAHARICNIIKHGESLGIQFKQEFNPALLVHPAEISLLKLLADFPETMETVLKSLEPQTVTTYLQNLATLFHKFYTECKVITDDGPFTQARLALITSMKIVLSSGLTEILGVKAPEKM